jgi:NAD(P)-dependent dehydrogenase (short-subunit alcohol dehydrogenase family)
MSRHMRGQLEGLSAIVTGGTAGIGEAIVRVFRARGARVVLVARGAEAGARLVHELGADDVAFLAADVTDPGTPGAAVALAYERFGALDVLVNNAGMDYVHEIGTAPLDDVRRVMEVNFVAPVAMIQAAAPALRARERGGAIVNVVSRLASIAVPGMNVYGATKAALHAITRGAAIELARAGVRVNSVAPGFTETPLMGAWLDHQPDPAEARRAALAGIPQGRFATPHDVAAAVAYLASPDAAHVTGASLAVDGGYTAQ